MGLFSKLFSKPEPEKEKPKPAQNTTPTKKEHQPLPPPIVRYKPKEYDIIIPDFKNGAAKAYSYSVKIRLTDEATIKKNALNKIFGLEAKKIEKDIHIMSNGSDIGILTERVEMLEDWISRGDPYLLYLEHLDAENSGGICTGLLVFYRDKRKGQDWREQTVVALTAYKSDDKQLNIDFTKEGEELELEEDFEHEDSIIVTAGGEIGKLPKKYAKRYLEEGAWGVFYERTEIDENYNNKPFIRIFWNSRKKGS